MRLKPLLQVGDRFNVVGEFVGMQEHFDTRKAVEAKLGDRFTYYDTVLSYGAPPVRFVRELMLDQPIE